VRETGFDHVGVFTYSHEEGTRAFSMNDDVPTEVKEARRSALMQLQQDLVAERQRARVGQDVRVMVDGPSPESPLVLTGRLEGQAPDIDAMVYLSDCDPSAFAPGEIVSARITDAQGYDLVASVSTQAAPPSTALGAT
jgi:tRNA A37 methylthiotransferase MiaB